MANKRKKEILLALTTTLIAGVFGLILVKGRVNSYQCGGVKVYHSG